MIIFNPDSDAKDAMQDMAWGGTHNTDAPFSAQTAGPRPTSGSGGTFITDLTAGMASRTASAAAEIAPMSCCCRGSLLIVGEPPQVDCCGPRVG